MSPNHLADIRIGDDEFIRHVPVPTDDMSILEPLDPFLRGVRQFLDSLEVECCAECRGIHAFKFSESAIRIAAINFGSETMTNEFRNIVVQIRDAESVYFVSERLNFYFHKTVLVRIFQHVVECIGTLADDASTN